MELFTTLLATTTGAGVAYVIRRQRRSEARLARWEERFAPYSDGPFDVGHLSPNLADLAIGARTARRVLETPLRRFAEVLERDSPWRLRQCLQDYDLALCNARLEIWRWLLLVARLDATEIAVLRTLGLDPRPLRTLVYKPGVLQRSDRVFQGGIFPTIPNADLVVQELCLGMDHLRQFEVTLLRPPGTPYR